MLLIIELAKKFTILRELREFMADVPHYAIFRSPVRIPRVTLSDPEVVEYAASWYRAVLMIGDEWKRQLVLENDWYRDDNRTLLVVVPAF